VIVTNEWFRHKGSGKMATRREEIFEKEIGQHGGALFLGDAPSIFQELRIVYALEASRIIKESQESPGPSGGLPFLFPGLTGSMNMNSCVLKEEGEYYVYLYGGAFLILHDMFSTFMSHKEVLRSVGDSSGERSNIAARDRQFRLNYGGIGVAECLKNHILRVIPSDNVRKAYALTLARLSFDFLFYHEVAHAIAGHLEYLGDIGLHPRLFERNNAKSVSSSGDRERTDFLEYDADRIAAEYVLEFLLRGIGTVKGEEQRLKALWDIAGALFFSLGVFFFTLAQQGERVSKWNASTHPHPVVRYVLTSAALVENASHCVEEGEFIFSSAFRNSFSEVVDACGALELPWDIVWDDSEEAKLVAEDVIGWLDAEEKTLSQLSHWRGIRRWSPSWRQYI
jgi:hypothetical protein